MFTQEQLISQPDFKSNGSTILEMERALKFLKSRDCSRHVEVDGYAEESFTATKTHARRMIRDRIAENKEIIMIADDWERQRRWSRQTQFEVFVLTFSIMITID
jgi:hypothetical protein